MNIRHWVLVFLTFTCALKGNTQSNYLELELRWVDPIYLWDTARINPVTRDKAGMILSKLIRTPLAKGNRDSVEVFYDRNSQGQLTRVSAEARNGENLVGIKKEFLYDNQGRLKHWDYSKKIQGRVGVQWEFVNRLDVKYSSDGDTTTLSNFDSSQSKWKFDRRWITFGNSEMPNRRVYFKRQQDKWVEYAMVTYNYDNNRLISQDSITPPYNLSKARYQRVYRYNNTGQLLEVRNDILDGSQTRSVDRCIYEYEENKFKSKVYQTQSGGFWTTQHGRRLDKVQDVMQGVDDATTESTIQLFPNPVKDRIFISGSAEIKRWEVRSLDGVTVLRGEDDNVEVTELNSGLYIILLVDKEGLLITEQFIKY